MQGRGDDSRFGAQAGVNAALTALEAVLCRDDPAEAHALLQRWSPQPPEMEGAAALALTWGWPLQAVAWSPQPLLRTAALLRLGQLNEAAAILSSHPQSGQTAEARPAVLRARLAALQGSPDTLPLAVQARSLARQEGDAAALVAAATLLGEWRLWGPDGPHTDPASGPHAALRDLAEGLKVAELTGEQADPHLLSVLAHAQAAAGGHRKAERTALKALERSAPRSAARVLALLALGRTGDAQAQALAGGVAQGWFWGVLGPGSPRSLAVPR